MVPGKRVVMMRKTLRYEALAQFELRAGLEDEAAWVERRLETIRHSAGN